MTPSLDQIIRELNLTALTQTSDFSEIIPEGGYASDLLSCVMAGAGRKNLWVTLQAHNNVVAVAALLELSAVIITENAQPDAETVAKATQENVILLSTPKTTFHVVGRLWEMGLKVD